MGGEGTAQLEDTHGTAARKLHTATPLASRAGRAQLRQGWHSRGRTGGEDSSNSSRALLPSQKVGTSGRRAAAPAGGSGAVGTRRAPREHRRQRRQLRCTAGVAEVGVLRALRCHLS